MTGARGKVSILLMCGLPVSGPSCSCCMLVVSLNFGGFGWDGLVVELAFEDYKSSQDVEMP